MSAVENEQNMKTVLLSRTVVALVGAMSLPANAAEWNVRVGGYMEQYVGYIDNDIDFTSSDQIDESYMFIEGSFGEVLLGSANSAGYKMTVAAPDVTFLNVDSGSLTMLIPFSGSVGGVSVGDDFFRGTLGTTFLENDLNIDAQRFTYFTPRFSGFQLGSSYARDGLQDTNAQVDADSTLSDIFDVGANYMNSFGDFDIAVSGRYGTASAPGPNPNIWSAGLNLGYAGVAISGSYAEQNDAGTEDGEVWDVGVSYETGPWGFSVTFQHGENVDDKNPGTDEELDQFRLGASYKLAKGIALNAYGAYVDFDEDVSDGGGSGDDIDAWVLGTAIKINF